MTSKEILSPVNETRNVLKAIEHGEHYWIGHILRREGFLHDEQSYSWQK